jgi:hypothetical protein
MLRLVLLVEETGGPGEKPMILMRYENNIINKQSFFYVLIKARK